MPAQSEPVAEVLEAAVERLLRPLAVAMDEADRHDRAALRDLAVPVDYRFDERTAAALRACLASAVASIERGLRLGAARRLAAMQADAAAERLLDDPGSVVGALTALAAAGDAPILAELLAIVRVRALAAGLPAGSPTGPDRPSLLVRLAECPEPDIAREATALLRAQNLGSDDAPPTLPPPMRERLVWWAAATLRGRTDDPRADHALVEAAEEMIAADPYRPSPADIAARLADLIRARPDELAALLVEAIGDRQPMLFAALLAQASGLDFAPVRAMMTDPLGDRLWLLLRSQDVDRATIARIGVALADADPRRDLDRFAGALDAVMAVDPEHAAHLFAPLTLPAAYRDALDDVAALRGSGLRS